jgi:Tol biopolymer transport system component
MWTRLSIPDEWMYWTISPDLRWIAYYERERPALGRISKEGDIQEVARIDVPFSEAKFSPDSTKILLMNGRRGELWVADVPEVGRKRLVYQDTTVYEMEWSPDSRWIAVVGADFRTRVVDLEGRVQSGVVPAAPYGKIRYLPFSWSPDGSRLVYTVEGPRTVWVMDIASGGQYMLTTLPSPPLGWRVIPCWSPSGMYIALVGGTTEGQEGVAIIDSWGKHILSVEMPVMNRWHCYWSPDGKNLAIETRQKNEAGGERDALGVLTMPEGTMRYYLTVGSGALKGWSPDSTAVIIKPLMEDMLVRLPLRSGD